LKRIDAIVSLIEDHYNTIYDICCDHGQIGSLCYQKKLASKIVYIDQVASIIKRLQTRITHQNAEFVISDASSVAYENSSNVLLIICGVGTETIIKILDSLGKDFKGDLLLSTHKNPLKLREYLIEKNYLLKKEKILKENNQFYEVMLLGDGGSLVSDCGSLQWDQMSAIEIEYRGQLIRYYEIKKNFENDEKYLRLLRFLKNLK
jgi:tRNA (adenine22-N1)-methyltransferase